MGFQILGSCTGVAVLWDVPPYCGEIPVVLKASGAFHLGLFHPEDDNPFVKVRKYSPNDSFSYPK